MYIPNRTNAIANDLALRARLEARYGKVWNKYEFQREFTIEAFDGGGSVIVSRNGDYKPCGACGSMFFVHAHADIFYHSFSE